jgi:hypothetical protein
MVVDQRACPVDVSLLGLISYPLFRGSCLRGDVVRAPVEFHGSTL